jgi:hypothetical protein
MRSCQKQECSCECFKTSFSCRCGARFDEHETVVMTADERRDNGLPVDSDVVEKRLSIIRTRKGFMNKFGGCGRCVACKCGMSCKKGDKNPWHNPSSSNLEVAKHMSNSEKIHVVAKNGVKLQRVGVSTCDCAVQGRVCKCKAKA